MATWLHRVRGAGAPGRVDPRLVVGVRKPRGKTLTSIHLPPPKPRPSPAGLAPAQLEALHAVDVAAMASGFSFQVRGVLGVLCMHPPTA
jgi:hypothetical protein